MNDPVPHLLERLSMSQVSQDPFLHMVIDHILPADLHAGLTRSLPRWEDLDVLAASGADLAGYDRRATALVARGPMRGSAWLRVHDALTDERIVDALSQSFGGATWPAPVADVRVDCDLANSAMTPHTDSPGKLLTCLIYLCCGPDVEGQGTRLCAPLSDWHVDQREYRHQDPDHFSVVKEVAFSPNRALLFRARMCHSIASVRSVRRVRPATRLTSI